MSGPVPKPTPSYPRQSCPACGSSEVTWTPVSGSARLVSYVINHRPVPPFDPDVALVVALVELDEGPRMLSTLVDVEPDPAQLELDMALSVRFVDRGDRKLPVFAPRWMDGTAVGGCSFLVHVRHAAAAIATGAADVVLVTHGESGRSRLGSAKPAPGPASLSNQLP